MEIVNQEIGDGKEIIMTMEKVFELTSESSKGVFLAPKFPTRRWGHIWTKTSSTNKKELDFAIEKLRLKGLNVLLKKDEFNTKKYKRHFWQIILKNA